jgi:hypothetical protein
VGRYPVGCDNHSVPSVDPAHLAHLVAGVDDNSAAYDLVLLAHVLSALVAMVALVVAGGFVPVLGVALIAMSGGQWGYSDGWVTIGLGAWVVVAFVAEGGLWPAERRLQAEVATREAVDGAGARAPAEADGADGAAPTVDPVAVCLRTGLLGIGLAVVLVAVAVLMVAKP